MLVPSLGQHGLGLWFHNSSLNQVTCCVYCVAFLLLSGTELMSVTIWHPPES